MQAKPVVLIMCGGRSMRLWPLSEYKSKNFLTIFGFSPLEFTIRRFLKITDAARIFLVASAREKSSLKHISLIPQKNIFYEPESKNTAAAVLFALSHLKYRCALDTALIISPVDHLIKGGNFYAALAKAVQAAHRGRVCVMGIAPDEPTPNFGYIQPGVSTYADVYAVRTFIEKPTRVRASKLIKQGCMYNSGMFVAECKTFLEEFRAYYPDYAVFERAFSRGIPKPQVLQRLYAGVADIPFDKAVMEKTKRAVMVKGKFYWKDFGSWQAVHEVLPKDGAGNASCGDVTWCQSRNTLVFTGKPRKRVLVLGAEDIFLVDTDDFLLVAHRSHIDGIKAALQEFRKK